MKIYDNNKNLLGIYINGQDFKNEKLLTGSFNFFFRWKHLIWTKEVLYKGMYTMNMKGKFLKHLKPFFMIDGKIKVDLYDKVKNVFIETVIIQKGEIIVMLDGGHLIEILEDSKFVEVKQGPYEENSDKNHF